MNIFLLNPPGKFIRTGRLVRESKISTQSWQPIFLAYATGVLEKLGYTCRLYDASVLGTSPEDTLKIVRDFHPEVIVYYWAYDTRALDLAYAERLAKEFRVILVGPWSAHYPEALKDCPSAESMTFGQFEYTLPNLIEKRTAQGVTYKDGTHIPQGDPYGTVDLDWMPFVTSIYKEHLSIPAYHQTSFRHPFVDFFASRDCPHRCAFCSWVNGMYQLHPERWHRRTLRNIMDELWYIKKELPEVNQVFFQDSTLVTPLAREISQAMIDEKLNLCWGAYSRADKDYDTLRLMKEAGCRTLHVGYEVPIQSILDEIKKDITVEQEARFIKNVNSLKLWTSSSFMIFPWMTPDQIKYMIKWIKDNNATRINVAQLQVYPNVPIVDVIKAYKDLPNAHLMDFKEMEKWEQYCFMEFYIKNPKFWMNVISNPREWRNVLNDAKGMLGFLSK
jgi:radical SAM superfamily enzyme YgiQ (UPF0313 family)